jgi:sterol desaturase/sphingolipid hydroxylase (fatty acid hydroxylase superfamily)
MAQGAFGAVIVADATAALLDIYRSILLSPSTLYVLCFASAFLAAGALLGLRSRVLTPLALRNTAASLATLALNVVMAPVVYVFAAAVGEAYGRLGIPAVPQSFWLGLPWIVVAVVGVIAKDFSDYWCHRALHTPIGWPVHAVHHSDTHVNGFTAFRVHLLEVLTMKVFYIVLLTWIGIPASLIVAAYVVASLHTAYVHLELDIDHGPLNWLIASPRFHRWHHADVPEAYGKNLANMIPLFDRVFGTYYRHDPCDVPMGALRDGVPDTDPLKLVLLPFTLWMRQARSSMAGLLVRLRAAFR